MYLSVAFIRALRGRGIYSELACGIPVSTLVRGSLVLCVLIASSSSELYTLLFLMLECPIALAGPSCEAFIMSSGSFARSFAHPRRISCVNNAGKKPEISPIFFVALLISLGGAGLSIRMMSELFEISVGVKGNELSFQRIVRSPRAFAAASIVDIVLPSVIGHDEDHEK